MKKPRIAVFISGRGSNMAVALEASTHYQVVAVVSSSAKAAGLLRAQRSGVATIALGKPIDWDALHTTLKQLRVDGILLAGFMKLLPESFVTKWSGKMVNIHPSLLPAYPGLRSIEKARENNHPVGVTIHDVITEMDAGKILAQGIVDAQPQRWALEDLEICVHAREHQLLRETVRTWANSLM